MRIAVFSDVHANLPALEAVLDFVDGLRVDATLCLGDLVGYGPHPREVIHLIRDRQIPCALGGSDMRVIFPHAGAPKSPETEAALEWTRNQLGEEERAFLSSLQPSLRLRTPYGRAKGFHGRPDNPEARFPIYAGEDELLPLIEPLRASIILTGGGHVPVYRRIARYFILDPGSVGLTLGGEPGADLAVLSVNGDGVRARIYKIPYDMGQTVFDIKAWGLPERIAQIVQTGKPQPVGDD